MSVRDGLAKTIQDLYKIYPCKEKDTLKFEISSYLLLDPDA